MTSVNFAKVALIKSDYELVINKGADDGVSIDDQFIIYRLGEEIKDPDTGESLGSLENVLGKVKAIHVQDKITTVISIDFESSPGKTEIKKITKSSSNTFLGALAGLGPQEITTTTPGENKRKRLAYIQIGDLVSKFY